MAVKWTPSILLPLIFLLQACSGNDGANAEASIIRDFASTPYAAVEKYKIVWGTYRGDDVSNERFVIASELMDYDSAGYEEYYGYVRKNLKNDDREYRLSAIRALRNARGIESLVLLFDAYESGNGEAAHAAADVIRIRYKKAKDVASLRAEQNFITERVRRLRIAKASSHVKF